MNQRSGLHEELKEKLKSYSSTNQRTYPIHPQQYADALTQQIARELGYTLEQLAASQRYDEMLTISQQIRATLHQQVPLPRYRGSV